MGLTARAARCAFSSSSALACASSLRTRSMFFLFRTCQLQYVSYQDHAYSIVLVLTLHYHLFFGNMFIFASADAYSNKRAAAFADSAKRTVSY